MVYNMLLKKNYKHIIINPLRSSGGFTLVEAMLCVALLALVAVGVSAPYISGFQTLDVQADHMLLDSQLCSRMEVLVGTDFGTLGNGSEVVTVNGQNYTVNWSVAAMDLDGDSNPEPTAKQVTVSITELPDRSLSTILVDHQGRVGKIS
jgi:type II secretory pathway component PulJ